MDSLCPHSQSFNNSLISKTLLCHISSKVFQFMVSRVGPAHPGITDSNLNYVTFPNLDVCNKWTYFVEMCSYIILNISNSLQTH